MIGHLEDHERTEKHLRLFIDKHFKLARRAGILKPHHLHLKPSPPVGEDALALRNQSCARLYERIFAQSLAESAHTRLSSVSLTSVISSSRPLVGRTVKTSADEVFQIVGSWLGVNGNVVYCGRVYHPRTRCARHSSTACWKTSPSPMIRFCKNL